MYCSDANAVWFRKRHGDRHSESLSLDLRLSICERQPGRYRNREWLGHAVSVG